MEKNHSIDKLLATLFIHAEPEFLKDEIRQVVGEFTVDKRLLERYTDLMRNIRYAWTKTTKYDEYFEIFYPPNGVMDASECLTHHVHAYLDDLYTLKQKIFSLLGALKNDATTLATNSDEFKVAIDELKKKMNAGWKDLDDQRGRHRHDGMRFVHGTLLEAENAETMIKQLDAAPFSDFYDEEVRGKLKERLKNDAMEKFDQAKVGWIKLAKQNKEMLYENLNKLFDGLAQNIYQLLRIEETANLLSTLKNAPEETTSEPE